MVTSNSIGSSGGPRKRVLLLSAYDGGSHARWRQELINALPEYCWESLTLPARHFRWRIRGNPLSWMTEPVFAQRWDALVATSMVDLATLRGLHPGLASTPALTYYHENQLAYPQGPSAHRSIDPAMVNLYSALSSDRVLFNSEWNRTSFLHGVDALMDRLPDKVPHNLSQGIASKSSIVPVPLRDELFQYRNLSFSCPHLVWNHRWEHDKGPDRLLFLLRELERLAFPFRLSVVGEQFRKHPDAFQKIADEFPHRVATWGYLKDQAAYLDLLRKADFVLSTALHDFQGLSVLEAMASGCVPLVPDRLAYTTYVPELYRYRSQLAAPAEEACQAAHKLIELCRLLERDPMERPTPYAYSWSRLAPVYRRELEALFSVSR